jgi:pyrroloquinoline quinone (PQQ) biosynthesis protein C
MDISVLEKKVSLSRKRLYETRLMREVESGTLPLNVYKGFVQETYHYVKHTTRFFVAAASRLPEKHERLRKALIEYAADESGHESYLLNDLKHLGVDPDAVRDSDPLIQTEALTGYHYYLAMFGNPVGIWGNVYSVEGFSNDKSGRAAETLMRTLGLSKNAVTFLISHGKFDVEHFNNAQQIIEKRITDPEDARAVTYCAQAALDLYAVMYDAIYSHYGTA